MAESLISALVHVTEIITELCCRAFWYKQIRLLTMNYESGHYGQEDAHVLQTQRDFPIGHPKTCPE